MNKSELTTRQLARLLGVSLNRIRYALLIDRLTPKRDEFGNFIWSSEDVAEAKRYFSVEIERDNRSAKEASDADA